MGNNGWIKLHRELLDKAIWKCSSAEQRVILITLLLMANHEEQQWIWKGEKYICKPGQFVTSIKSIAEKSETTEQNVRTALDKFEKLEFLTNESTKQNRLITIVNWAFYQLGSDDGNKQTNNQLTNKLTVNQQTTNKQLTTNKNEKNEKNEKNHSSYRLTMKKNDEPFHKYRSDDEEFELRVQALRQKRDEGIQAFYEEFSDETM